MPFPCAAFALSYEFNRQQKTMSSGVPYCTNLNDAIEFLLPPLSHPPATPCLSDFPDRPPLSNLTSRPSSPSCYAADLVPAASVVARMKSYAPLLPSRPRPWASSNHPVLAGFCPASVRLSCYLFSVVRQIVRRRLVVERWLGSRLKFGLRCGSSRLCSGSRSSCPWFAEVGEDQ